MTRLALQPFLRLKPELTLGAGEGASAPPLVAANSNLVFDGDSITAQGYGTISDWYASNFSWGWSGWAMPISGGRLFQPVGGNVAVPSETIAQMYARRAATIALEPVVLAMLGGTNDISGGASAATVIARLQQYWNYMLANGVSYGVAITILPRFAPNALTAPQEAIRLEVNAWLRARASSNLKVVDADTIGLTTDDFVDGLHPNTLGAFKVGQLAAATLEAITAPDDVIDSWVNAYSPNPTMAGSDGSISGGATGVSATSFDLGANDAGGATIVGSKETIDGHEWQVITISGTYTGDNKFVNFSPFVAATIAEGDVPEFIAEMKISGFDSIVSVRPLIAIFTAGFVTIEYVEAYTSADQMEMPESEPNLVMRTAVIPRAAGTAAWQQFGFNIGLKNVGAVPTAISGVVKIGRNRGRLVPGS